MIAGAAVFAVAVACYAPTELVVAVDTDLGCDAVRKDGMVVRTARDPALLPDADVRTTSASCEPRGDRGDMGTLVLVPNGGADEVAIEIVLGVDVPSTTCRPPDQVTGCIVARRRLSFVRHRSLRVPITLDRSCVGIACSVDQTCERGRCTRAEIGACPDDTCAAAPGPPDRDSPGSAGDAGARSDGGSEIDGGRVTRVDSGICQAPPPQPTECNCQPNQECCISSGGVRCVLVGGCEPGGSLATKVCTADCQCVGVPCVESCFSGLKVCGAPLCGP